MQCLVVADDLTGALDSGSRFARRGFDTTVTPTPVTDPADWNSSTVGVYTTESRYLKPTEAMERVTAAITGMDAGTVYKKVDSMLRGNVAHEAEAARRAASAHLAIIAPAFPAAGRITVGGYHLVDTVPVAETPAGADKNGPETSSLPDLLAASASPVHHVPLETVADRHALKETLDGLDPGLVACDATTAQHLSTIGVAANQATPEVIFVGSAGLAGHVPLTGPRTVLGVIGSPAPQTRAQLAALPTNRVVKVDPTTAVTDPESAARTAATTVSSRLTDNHWAVITAATTESDLERGRDAGEATGLDSKTTADRIRTTLATAARIAHRERDLDGMLLTGGDVAAATVDELGTRRIQPTGAEFEAGLPIVQLVGGAAAGTVCITKAGAFGSEETVLNCLRFLTRYNGA